MRMTDARMPPCQVYRATDTGSADSATVALKKVRRPQSAPPDP